MFSNLPGVNADGLLHVANAAALPDPLTVTTDAVRVTEDDGSIYVIVSGAWQKSSGGGGGGSGTVTSVSVATAHGISGTVANPTTTPAITLTLGAITPSSVAATGTVTGSNLSGTNTGDQAAASANTPSTLVLRDSSGNFVAGTITAALTGTASGNPPNARTISTTAPLMGGGDLSANLTLSMPVATVSNDGFMSSALVNILNNKQDIGTGNNYVTNQSIEVDDSGYNTYDNIGRTVPAFVVEQDLTFTSALSGDSGNGVNIEYIYNASFPSSTPNINVISSSHVQVRWNNGPTVANNPTATQLKTAWDAVPAALAIATIAISGTSTKLQYITGAHLLANGGDTAPTDGTGGSPTGLTISRTTINPLVGTGSLLISKDAANREGLGVSTDLSTVSSADLGNPLQISFYYNASSGMVLGASSDVKIFIYDVTNATMLPITSVNYLTGTTGSTHKFTGTFTASPTSSQYRLIWHVTTASATAWDLRVDEIIVNNSIDPATATQVPKLVIQNQTVSGAVTDHMVVMWTDGASQWVPATISGATSDPSTLLGFAVNISGSIADIVVAGALDGFSFGPFAGYNQYIDNTAGNLSPLPSPFHDSYVSVGKGISTSTLDIQFTRHADAIGVKGGLLTNNGVNDGTGDVVLTVGTNGQFLMANSAVANGIAWTTPIATTPLTYTASTHTWALTTVPISLGGTGLTSTSQNFAFIGPTSGSGAPTWRLLTVGDLPTISSSVITNASGVTGTTASDALNTLNQNVQEVLLQAVKNAGSVTANTTIPTWTTVNADTLTGFNSSTGVYTVQVAGDYEVDFTAATTSGTPLAQIYKNGSLVQTGTGSGVRTSAFSTIVGCAVNDTITVALDSSLTLTSSATDTSLSIRKLSGASSAVINARYHGATATVTSSLSDVTWSTKDFDTKSAYSGTTFTVPASGAGTYQIQASLGVTATTVAAGNTQILILMKNGVEIARYTFVSGAATQKPAVLHINDLFQFAATDTIKFQVSSASTGPSISASNTQNFFTINKVSN